MTGMERGDDPHLPDTFPLRTRWWSRILTLTAHGPLEAVVETDRVCVRMGWLGHAEIPITAIARIGSYHWPWFGGYGARIGKGLVGFVAAPGPATLIELTGPVKAHLPAPWETSRIVVGVADPTGFAAAVAARRDAPGGA